MRRAPIFILLLGLLGGLQPPSIAQEPEKSVEAAAREAREAANRLVLTRLLAVLRLTATQSARFRAVLAPLHARLEKLTAQEVEALARLRPAAEEARRAALGGRAGPSAVEGQFARLERDHASQRRRARSDSAASLRKSLAAILTPGQMETLEQAARDAGQKEARANPWTSLGGRSLRRGAGHTPQGGRAGRMLDQVRTLSPEEWGQLRARLAGRAGGSEPEPPDPATRQRLTRRLELLDRARAMSGEEYSAGRAGLASDVSRVFRPSQNGRAASPDARLEEYLRRTFLGPTAPRALAASDRKSSGPVSRHPPPAEREREAEAARRTMEEARVVGAVNALRLSPEQAVGLTRALAAWESAREESESAAARQLESAATLLRQAVEHPEEGGPASGYPERSEGGRDRSAQRAYAAAVEGHGARLQAARRAALDSLAALMTTALSPKQLETALALGREELRRAILDEPATAGAAVSQEILPDLETLRRASAVDYPRGRDLLARRLAGALPPGTQRELRRQRQESGGEGRAELPPVADPALRQRVDRQSAALDRIRALPKTLWLQQRDAIARRLLRDRRAAQVDRIQAGELLRAFIEEYLLLPSAAAALRARFAEGRSARAASASVYGDGVAELAERPGLDVPDSLS